jgi:hypothetical protein
MTRLTPDAEAILSSRMSCIGRKAKPLCCLGIVLHRAFRPAEIIAKLRVGWRPRPVRPRGDPEAAARKLLDIVRASIATSGLPYAYTGKTNSESLSFGGSVDECSAGCRYAADRQWFRIERSGTRFEPLPDGAE